MRQIKFRGKRIDNGEWVKGYYVKHITRQVCPIGDELKDEEILHLIAISGFADWDMPKTLNFIKVKPETVGQYTGEKDENGKEIYEGDVLKCLDSCDEEYTTTVVFKDGAFQIDVQNADYDFTAIGWSDIDVQEKTIIGNIHENPEWKG